MTATTTETIEIFMQLRDDFFTDARAHQTPADWVIDDIENENLNKDLLIEAIYFAIEEKVAIINRQLKNLGFEYTFVISDTDRNWVDVYAENQTGTAMLNTLEENLTWKLHSFSNPEWAVYSSFDYIDNHGP